MTDRSDRTAEHSLTFPMVPLAEVARFLHPDEAQDDLGVIRSFRDWVCQRRGLGDA